MIPQLAEVRDEQLAAWPLARANYEALAHTERRAINIGSLHGALQCNPARIVSTGARTDAASIGKRPCFLCAANRPPEQLSEEIIPGWEFLVNPYPIFPLHFTIASTQHIPQGDVPLEMASMAERLPGMTVFFNGAKAGASAPDHLHCQTVITSELPLMRYLEEGRNPDALPFKVHYSVIRPDVEGMIRLHLLTNSSGPDSLMGCAESGLVNAYMWIGEDGMLRVAVVPRKAHRPSCYTTGTEAGYMVSPGAIDMAGVVILPRRADFDSITQADVDKIYSEVALPPSGTDGLSEINK